MPDTGAPWNIPYVASTDLVSDWPADSLALANAIDAGLDAAGNAGIGSNVVQATKGDSYSTTNTAYQDVTGLSVSITPTSATSKVLVITSVNVSNSGAGTSSYVAVARNGTRIGLDTNGNQSWQNVGVDTDAQFNYTHVFLDSPASASAVTYQVQLKAESGSTARINERGVGLAYTFSSITVIEVAE